MGKCTIKLILIGALVAVSSAGIISRDSDNSSSEESKETEAFLSEIRSSCMKKTGSNETFDRLATHFALVPICIGSTLDVENFASNMDKLTKSDRIEFFDKYCPQFDGILSCLTPITTEFRKCVDDKTLEFVDVIVGLIPEAINLMCKEHGQIFYMDDANFDECSGNFLSYAEKCTEKISNATEAMDLAQYGAKQCGEVEQVRRCFQTKLDECKAPRLMDLFDLFYQPVIKESPCHETVVLDESSEIEKNTI